MYNLRLFASGTTRARTLYKLLKEKKGQKTLVSGPTLVLDDLGFLSLLFDPFHRLFRPLPGVHCFQFSQENLLSYYSYYRLVVWTST